MYSPFSLRRTEFSVSPPRSRSPDRGILRTFVYKQFYGINTQCDLQCLFRWPKKIIPIRINRIDRRWKFLRTDGQFKCYVFFFSGKKLRRNKCYCKMSETYGCMWHHNVAGVVVAFLPNFVQPILWLWIVCERINHFVCCAALHLHQKYSSLPKFYGFTKFSSLFFFLALAAHSNWLKWLKFRTKCLIFYFLSFILIQFWIYVATINCSLLFNTSQTFSVQKNCIWKQNAATMHSYNLKFDSFSVLN